MPWPANGPTSSATPICRTRTATCRTSRRVWPLSAPTSGPSAERGTCLGPRRSRPERSSSSWPAISDIRSVFARFPSWPSAPWACSTRRCENWPRCPTSSTSPSCSIPPSTSPPSPPPPRHSPPLSPRRSPGTRAGTAHNAKRPEVEHVTDTDTGSARFRTFFNPATGEWIEFTAVPEDGEDVVRFRWRSMPGGAITEHVHPHQEERFTITSGEAHFTLSGEERVVGPGETIVVPAGIRHSEINPGSVQIEGVVELRPALHSKEMHEAFGGLAAEGKATPRGAPKNPLQLGATLWRFHRESRVTSPPIWVQNLLLPALSALARVFGVRAYRAGWDSRVSSGPPLACSSSRPMTSRR